MPIIISNQINSFNNVNTIQTVHIYSHSLNFTIDNKRTGSRHRHPTHPKNIQKKISILI